MGKFERNSLNKNTGIHRYEILWSKFETINLFGTDDIGFHHNVVFIYRKKSKIISFLFPKKFVYRALDKTLFYYHL